jgi:hypothetical protein
MQEEEEEEQWKQASKASAWTTRGNRLYHRNTGAKVCLRHAAASAAFLLPRFAYMARHATWVVPRRRGALMSHSPVSVRGELR